MRKPVRPARSARILTSTAACLIAVLGMAAPAQADPPSANQQGSAADNTSRQIAALQQIKKSQSKTDAKLDSKLLVELRSRGDRSVSSALPKLASGAKVSTSGTVLVDIRADKVSDDLINQLSKSGAAVRAVSNRYGSIRAEVPLSSVGALAARGDVRKIEVADGAMTARELKATPNTKPAPPESKEAKAARIEAETRQALQTRAGAITSEGDRAHNADSARQQFGVTGIGTKICALSDGVDSLSVSEAAGELPHVDVLPTQEGSGDEGTAMLEIIHDIAPGASLGFATAFNSDASFADNIRALRFDRGCDIIVDDIIYFKEAPFQDWIIAQAVNDVTADGALYFSSAGNEGNTLDGTTAHWEGDFVDSGQVVGKYAGTAHDFDPGPGTQIYEPISDASSAGVPILLNWADPLGASDNDYDLYLLDAAGNVVALSQDYQTGTQDAYERVDTPAFGGTGLRLAIVKFSGANRYLSLSGLRGRFSDSADGLKAFNTPGITFGHSAARQAFSVAAAPASVALPFDLEPGDPANPTGPFPGAYDGNSKIERFSSDGPRRMFFEADGTPIPGSEVRQKPEIAAADGVRTSVGGFDPFFGTSAAAPHAAAIAGLVLSGNPGIAPNEVREALLNTAVDLAPAGVDNRSGHGIILADRVLGYTGASPQPFANATDPTVRANDGGAFLDPGDTATVTLPVTNTGDAAAVSTSVVLTSPTAGVVIAPRSKNYGTVDKGQTGVNTFQVTIPATHQVGLPFQLSAKVTFAGSLSPTTATFVIPVGQPSAVVHDFAYAGAPVAIPDNNPLGASVQIPVTGIGRASALTFSIDGTTCSANQASTLVGLDHSFVGDLVGTLTSPTGAVATVFQRNGGGGNNFCKVVFADSATKPISDAAAANAPYTGSWKPTTSLAGLRADVVDGNWTFKVVDAAAGDLGFIRSVSLHINGFVTPGSP